jgi:hypothetical protein
MPILPNRRRFLTDRPLAGRCRGLRPPAASAGHAGRGRAARNRFCVPRGFTDIRFIAGTSAEVNDAVASGKIDVNSHYASEFVTAIDGGAPIYDPVRGTVGCFELFVQDGIRTVTDLE